MLGTRQQAASFLAALAITVLCALLSSRGAGFIIAEKLAPREAHGAAGLPLQEARLRKSPAAILQRNIFDAEAGPLGAQPQPSTAPEVTEAVDPEALAGEPCEASVSLAGIVYDDRQPERSLVAISAGQSTNVLRAAGPASASGWKALRIRAYDVLIQKGTQPACSLRLFQIKGRTQVARRAPPLKTSRLEPPAGGMLPARPSAISESEYSSGIQRLSETRYNVSRSLLNKVLANNGEVMQSAQVVPYEENGKTMGVRVARVRHKSMISRIGLKPGDLLNSINGFDLSSPDTALEAYSKLRTAENLTLSIVRGGRKLQIDYRVR